MNQEDGLKPKITFLFLCVCFCFLAILARVIYLQFIIKDQLISYSESQFVRRVKSYSNRGRIVDRNGNPLALNIRAFDIFTMPKELSKNKQELRDLGKIVKEIRVSKFIRLFNKRKKFTWLGRNLRLNEEEIEKIKKLKGVYLEERSRRFYPNGDLLAQTLGFVGIDNNGMAGIEYKFNELLKGKEKTISYVKDAKGRSIRFESKVGEAESRDIELSIDKTLQERVEKFLKEGVVRHKALRGGAAVMDASTGEILAMANYPSFNPNIKYQKSGVKKLSFISDPFEPGSVLKTITIAAALEEKIAKKDSIYFCENGRFQIGKHFIKESAGHSYKWLPVSEILKVSSNIGTTKIAFDLGYKRLRTAFLSFGLGEKTNIELPSESRGIFDFEAQKISDIQLSNISFGQGIAVTGAQLLASYTPFANNGFYVKPTILKKESSVEKIQVISSKTANIMTEMMEKVVSEGTAEKAKVANYKIAGKTGTAQKPSSSGGYEGYISTFIGYPVGVKRPFVVLVYIDDPKENGHYGNDVAAPVFSQITESVLIKNKEFQKVEKVEEPEILSQKVEDKISSKVSAVEKIDFSKTPSLIGLDKKSIMEVAQKWKVRLKVSGFGIVYKQYPKAGENISTNKTIKVLLKNPNVDE
jgi:cell division protein FtsI (penicillin-binding protein 3)